MTVSQTAAAIEGAAGSIQQTAAQIIALARTLVEDPPPPVIVIKRRSIIPGDMPGRNDSEKVAAAMQEAIERQRPVEFDRLYVREGLELDERYDLIRILARGAGTGLVMPDVPSTAVQTWGWQLHLHPKPGKRLRVTLGNIELNGNRDRVAPRFNTTVDKSFTQHGVVLGGYYDSGEQGEVELEAYGLITHSHDFSGFVSMSDRNRFDVTGMQSFGNGQSGCDITRGRGAFYDSLAFENGGLQFNASNSPSLRLVRCKALMGGRGRGKPPVGGELVGGGIKISRRPWVNDVSVPVHLHLEDVLVDGCVGAGLSSTSSPPGSRITGSLLQITGGYREAINLTQHPGVSLEVRDIVCADNRRPLYADVAADPALIGPSSDAAVVLFEGPTISCETLRIRGSAEKGVTGGWGSSLSADVLEVTDCGGAGATWEKGRWDVGKMESARNGAADAISEQ